MRLRPCGPHDRSRVRKRRARQPAPSRWQPTPEVAAGSFDAAFAAQSCFQRLQFLVQRVGLRPVGGLALWPDDIQYSPPDLRLVEDRAVTEAAGPAHDRPDLEVRGRLAA